MLLSFITTILALPSNRREVETKFLDEFSLIPPHVGANGREDFFEFDNHYVVKTRSRYDYTRLGYPSSNSYGMVKSKNTLKTKDFDISIEFTLNDVSKGGKFAGVGFWLSDSILNQPNFYGRNQRFNGMGVVIDIEGAPSIRLIDGTGKVYSSLPLKSDSENLYLKFEKRKGTLQIRFNTHEKKQVLYDGPSKIPKDSFISITSFSGSSKTTLQINRIITNGITMLNKPVYVKGEKRKMSKLVVAMGAACIIGLVYYLYQKGSKEMNLKN